MLPATLHLMTFTMNSDACVSAHGAHRTPKAVSISPEGER